MQYRIDSTLAGMPLKKYLFAHLRLSGAFVTALKKRADGLLVNGEHVTVRYLLRDGDILSVADAEGDCDTSDTIVPTYFPLTVLYEDRDMIAVNKPPFMPTHPSHGHYTDTLANGLAYYYRRRGVPFVFRSGSRLDRDTSGIVLVAKNRTAAYRFYEQHTERSIRKTYLAVLVGTLKPETGEISGCIRREKDSVITRILTEDDGAPSLTRYRVRAYLTAPDGTPLTYVEAEPVTGRTHQLRVHFASRGTPILGDFLYGEECAWFGRQALHAWKQSFPHPATGERITLCAALPGDMETLLRTSAERNGSASAAD